MIKIWKIFCVLFVCAFSAGCLNICALAVDVNNNRRQLEELAYQEASGNDAPITRVSSYFNVSLGDGELAVTDTSFFLEIGDTVSFNASYSPNFANLDYGLIAPDGYFYYANSTNGSMNKSIRVSQHGEYTLAIQNNTAFTVWATGYVNY